MILRFFSGSVIPRSARKNFLEESIIFKLIFKDLAMFSTSLTSFFLSKPVSIKMHVSCLPIDLLKIAATTDESTPPESAKMTLSLPTLSLTS